VYSNHIGVEMSGVSEGKRLLAQMAMLDKGIAPVCPKAAREVMFFPLSASAISLFDNPIDEVRRFLASLPPDEQRKAKRKFRKMWRQTLSRSLKKIKGPGSIKITRDISQKMMSSVTNADGKTQPAPKSMHLRIHAVYQMLLEEISKTSE